MILLLPRVTEGNIEKQNCYVLIYMYFADIFSLYFSWLQSLVFWIWFYLNSLSPGKCGYIFLKLSLLTHWGRDKMAVFKIRSETCRTDAQFCQNLYMIKKDSLPDRPKILPVRVHGPALILKTEMAAILQTTFSNAFSWMKRHEFHLRFHWSLFLRFELTIFQHWFR